MDFIKSLDLSMKKEILSLNLRIEARSDIIQQNRFSLHHDVKCNTLHISL